MLAPNPTKNQHFISQAEQRLNSINPNGKIENQKIYTFDVTDRESFAIRLRRQGGSLIRKSLSHLDLYSFDRVDSQTRYNFEKLFTPYEDSIGDISTRIIEAALSGFEPSIADIHYLYRSKMLNYLRNPFSITKAMNTFGAAANFQPAKPEDLKIFHKVISGQKPHQLALCKQLGISSTIYDKWLRAIYMLLSHFPNASKNIFDTVMDKTLSDSTRITTASFFLYDDNDMNCLLSDRGFTEIKNTEDHHLIEFNLSSKAFVVFGSQSLSSFAKDHPEMQSEQMKNLATSRIFTLLNKNDINHLKSFNSRAIYQCNRCVLSSSLSNLILPI